MSIRKPTKNARPKRCAQCGEEFVPLFDNATRTGKFCTRECGWQHQKDKAAAGRPPREEVAPLFEANTSDGEIARRYGKSAWWAGQMRRAYGFPAWRKNTGHEIQCAECGTMFYASASTLGRGRKYCSRKCMCARARLSPETYQRMADQFSVERRGAGNPVFKHGKDGNRPRRGTFGLKLKGEKHCRNCGTTKNLGLHHVLPRSFFRAGRDELLNGIPLCTWCHLGWHRRYVTLYRDLFTASEWAYLTSVKLTGQEIMPWLDERYPVRPAREEAA